MSSRRNERLASFFQVAHTTATSVPRHEVEVSFLELAELLDTILPPSRRSAVAFTALEEAYLWSMHSLNALDAPSTLESINTQLGETSP